MAGYGDTPDAGADAAREHVENLVYAAQQQMRGPVLAQCRDCGEDIDPRRVEAALEAGRACQYCITCQAAHDRAPQVRMLTHIL